MKRSLSRAAALLALSLPSLGDNLLEGFKSQELPIPGDVAFDVFTDGRYVTMDGQSVDLWDANGSLITNLAFLPGASAGALAIHPSENWVLVGDRNSGTLYRCNLGGSSNVLANLEKNQHAAWENGQTAVISADTDTLGSGSELWRLTHSSGTLEALATVSGIPGPVAVDSDDAVIVAANSPLVPAPANSSDVYRFPENVLGGTTGGGAPTFDSDGVLVVEMEDVNPVGDWVKESSVNGYTGSGYFRWDGPDLFNSPGSGILTWEFQVEQSDDYQLRLHNHHDHPDTTLENDCWVRMDNGPWEKVYSGGFFDQWNWASTIDHEDPVPDELPIYNLNPGLHTMQISGRSKNYRINRFHLFKVGASNSTDLSKPPSEGGGSGPLPDLGSAQLVMSNLDNVTSMDIDEEFDTLFIAESNTFTGVHRIHVVGDAFPEEPVLLNTQGDAEIFNVRFVEGDAPGAFYPFQPANTGELHVGRLGFSPFDPQRIAIEAARPALSVSGPGTSGFGDFTLALDGGAKQGFYFLMLDALSSYNPVEELLFIDGIPLLHTGLNASSVVLISVPLPLDGNGDASLSLTNSTGLSDFVVFQYLVMNPSLQAVGTSTPALL